jgi:hypothetical protein
MSIPILLNKINESLKQQSDPDDSIDNFEFNDKPVQLSELNNKFQKFCSDEDTSNAKDYPNVHWKGKEHGASYSELRCRATASDIDRIWSNDWGYSNTQRPPPSRFSVLA